jgi:hypothetical protein
MKVLFLDIDGVLASMRTAVAFGGWPHRLHHAMFDPVAIGLVRAVCRGSGAKVVLSSAWRILHKHDDVGRAFELPIIDSTPQLIGARGTEIADWLAKHPEVTAYAIVDDDSDMLPEQMPRFVKTSAFDGLNWSAYLRLCELLGCNPHDGAPRERNQVVDTMKLQWEGA